MVKVLRYFDKKQKVYIGVALIFIVLQVWLDLKLPDYMSNITTLVETKGSSMTDILAQGGYMLACAIGSMIASIIVGYYAAVVAAGLSKTLRGLIFDKTMSFSMAEINQFSTASLINRTTNDITQIQTLIAMGLQAIIKAPILAIWAVIKISGNNWQWSASTAVAVFVLVIMLAATLIFAVPRFKRIQGITDKLNRIVREHLTGIRVVHAYNAEKYQEEKFAVANEELTETNLVANRVMAIMSPGMTLINSGLTLAVYWIGAILIQNAHMEDRLSIFSDMVVFSNYAMQVIMAFMLLNMIFILFPRAQVSAKRIMEVLEKESSIEEGEGVENLNRKGEITFEHVTFRYPDGGENVISDISFHINKGQTFAVIGATGSGKSSLIQLIPRLYDCTEGVVKVDGIDVKKYKEKDLNNKIGYVTQKSILFSGTVESNVAYGECEQNLVFDDVKEAIEIAQATDFVEKMEGTYKAPIAQGGTNVSGGQKQRILIARAIAKKPEILVFDDSFSALDYRTDKILRKTLNEKSKEQTKVIVAQRIGTIRHADQILVLEHGKIAGIGTHEELMKSCKVYKEITYSQLSKEELENA